jgi:hypothetical protein
MPHALPVHINRRLNVMARVALALALVALQLGGLAHVALAEHQLCWEHGEWLESGAHEPTGAASQSHPGGSVSWVVGDAAQAELTQDEHCSVLARLRTTLEPRPAFEIELLQTVELSADPGQVSDASSLVTLYRLAPKQSPPTA